MKDQTSLEELYARYLSGNLNSEEELQLWAHILRQTEESNFSHMIEKELHTRPPLGWENQAGVKNALDRVHHNIFGVNKQPSVPFFKKWIPYAAILILVSAISFYLFQYNSPQYKDDRSPLAVDISAGSHRATLTLPDGSELALDEDRTELILDSEIHYADGKQLIDQPIQGDVVIQTPRGGIYQLTLSDGSKVWMNAASKLTYNPSFAPSERKIYVEGEIYVEVTPDSKRPFIVVTSQQVIQVLGTKFNVSAYPDDPHTLTTLIEGQVDVCRIPIDVIDPQKINSNTIDRNYCTRLFLGEQSLTHADHMHKRSVETADAIAWKEGITTFRGEDLQSVLRKIERWYDIEFEVDNWPQNMSLDGQVPRDIKLSGILKILEWYTDKHFEIVERRVIEVN